MQLPVPPPSQSWPEKVLWLAAGIFSGTGLGALLLAWLNHIFNRPQQRSQVAKNTAEAQHTTLDGLVSASNQIIILTDKIQLLEAEIDSKDREYREHRDKREEEHKDSVQFYREQIEFFEVLIKYYKELDLAYRNRSHDLNGEFNRLVLAIHELELKYTQETNKEIDPIAPPAIEKINKKWPLPVEPAKSKTS